MIFLYQVLSTILSPLISLYLTYRKFKKKEDLKRFNERLGISSITRPQGFLVWMQCASVGESKSALTLAREILKEYPKINILITSGTTTSAAEIAKHLPKNTIHQYTPVDKLFYTKNFIKHWKPDLAIFIESELWPNLITQTKKSGCNLVLLNGKMSDKSFKIWKILHKIDFNLLKNFSICFAQSKIDQQKFNKLGIKNTKFVGNLKSANDQLKVNQDELGNLKSKTSSRKLWLAASTHKGEEEIIIHTHQKLKKYFPNLLTVIAPRHPLRLNDITKTIPSNIKIAIRSKNQSIENCEIYLADTMGEMGTFYALAPISIICGSLLENIGGHNPFEALQLKSVILSGKFVSNFEEIYQDLSNLGLCKIVKNQNELFFYLLKLMKDKNYHNQQRQIVESFDGNNSDVARKVIADLSSLLNQ
jgi:3-deoxy-D-manno-octulosonic-acid transferase